ncbi:MAG: kinesin [Acidobacteria bacterium]|nr:MAG: kinesin [Acidobacteriota bacterium]
MRERKICVFALMSLLSFVTLSTAARAPSPPSDTPDAKKLTERAQELYKAGKYSEAIPIATRLVELREKALGPEHPGTGASLNNLAELYVKLGDYAKARPLYQRALKICEKAFGPEHRDTATILDNLGRVYLNTGEFAKAEPLLQRSLKIREKVVGPEDLNTAKTLNNLATLYQNMGDYAKAEPLFQRALKICEKVAGPEHAYTASGLNNLGQLYMNMGDYAKAEPLLQRALRINEKALGSGHPDIVGSLNGLAQLYMNKGDYAKAEPLFQRALKIREKRLGPEHPATAATLGHLASLYRAKGDYGKAEKLYERALRTTEKALGPEHPATATSLASLGSMYRFEMGAYPKAKPLLQRALKIREKALGPEHPDTATSLHELALLYENTGDYAKAEPLFQRALEIREKVLGPEHPATAASVGGLGYLYLEMDSYDKAEPLLQRALRIDEKALGPEHLGTALNLNNLGNLYSSMGDYAKAEPLFQRALKIYDKAPQAFGPKHRRIAAQLACLANIYRKQGKYATAEPLYQRALKIVEEGFGPENTLTADYLSNLGWYYVRVGNYTTAEQLCRRALQIRGSALGPEHPSTAESLGTLAYVYIGKDDPQQASGLAVKARRIREKFLSDILSFTSEQQRLAFQSKTSPYDLPGTLGDAPELAETVLREKGVVLDSLLEDRVVAESSGDPKQREIIAQLRSAKQRLIQLQLEVPTDLSEPARQKRDAEKEKLSTEVEQLESGLARQFAGLGKARRALSVTVAQVQSALPKQSALIELLRYSHYLGKDKDEPRYGAVVIGANVEPRWVPLGNASEIEKNIGLYQKSVHGKTDETTLSSVLRSLNNQTWAPIEKALPAETKTVTISPDAELSFVSFATLVGNDDKFVGEKYSVRYVASGRDLLREFKRANNSQASVYANPDFGTRPASPNSSRGTALALRSIEMQDLQSIAFPPLPGSAAEAAALEKRLGSSVKVFLGAKATKTELQRVNSPYILHLATHGFFLPEVELSKETNPLQRVEDIPQGKLVNPMHRSGLALAGAQTTLQAWARGEVPPIENNGIVTAEEVGGLKLDGTWLVVLSACETGSGEARAGEGVMGLRRGFIQAGAQNLLMTLWPISDQTTVQIMVDFYDTAERTKNAPQALAEVQRDWLVKLRKERRLLDAVRLAGPFIMSSQGKQ